MKKFLLMLAAIGVAASAQAMIYTCGNFNSSKKTCTLIGWSGSQPSSGKLTIPSSFTHTDGVTYTVTAVAAHALDNLTDVVDITVPTSVLVIGSSNNADKKRASVENFNNCPNLITFHVASGHTIFSTKNSGILCSQDGTVLYRVPAEIAVDTDGQIDLNTKIRFIAEGSFVDNNSIKILGLPVDIFGISRDAGFNTMKSLAKFTLSTSNDSYVITDGALIDKDLNWLMSYPPKRTNQNLTLTSNVTCIRYQAFANTKYLKTLTLPQTVIDIEDEAFFNSSVTSISMPKKLEELGNKVFAKSKLESMTMWAPTNFDGYDEDIFAYCTSLKTLTIKGSNPRFNPGFARGCTALTTVTCDNTPLEIRAAAFKGCVSLTSFPFSASTDVFGDSIFAETGFTQVVYPSDAPKDGLEPHMFYYCRQLEKIDLSAVTGTADKRFMVITQNAISFCTKLKEIRFPKYTSFAGPSGFTNTPNIGPSCPLEKIVIHSFSTNDDQVFLHYSTTFSPAVYIKTTDITDCFGEWDNLFTVANGGSIAPKLYCEGWEPVSKYHYVVPGAYYYIPGNCTNNYRDAADNSKCIVKEMFSIKAENVAGKIKVTVLPLISGVEMTYVTYNEAFGAKPDANGVVAMGNSYSDVKKIRVSYNVNGEKMTTVYPITDFAGVEEVKDSMQEDVKISIIGRHLAISGCTDTPRVEVISMIGSKLLDAKGTDLNLDELPAGTYLIRVTDANGAATRKIQLR